MLEKNHHTKIITVFLVTALLWGCSTPGSRDSEPATPRPTAEATHIEDPSAPISASPAQPPTPIKPSAPKRYVVKQGDTLWGISEMFLAKPWYWPEIWQSNPQIDNPHLIYPGDVLTLFYIGDRPYIQVTDGPRFSGGSGTVKLSPSIRVEPLDQTKATIPIQAIQELIFEPHVLTKAQLDSAPYIVSGNDYRLIYSSGDLLYIRDLDPNNPEDRYSVVRPGPALKHHRSGEVLAYATDPVGTVKMLKDGDPATGQLMEVTREALPGDLLFGTEHQVVARDFVPHAPQDEVEGEVIYLFDAISMIGQLQVAVVDLGTQDGIDKGTVLRSFKTGPVLHDPRAPRGESSKVKMPDEEAGLLMVFRAFDRLSYALVMEANRPIEVGDTARSPEPYGSIASRD